MSHYGQPPSKKRALLPKPGNDPHSHEIQEGKAQPETRPGRVNDDSGSILEATDLATVRAPREREREIFEFLQS